MKISQFNTCGVFAGTLVCFIQKISYNVKAFSCWRFTGLLSLKTNPSSSQENPSPQDTSLNIWDCRSPKITSAELTTNLSTTSGCPCTNKMFNVVIILVSRIGKEVLELNFQFTIKRQIFKPALTKLD